MNLYKCLQTNVYINQQFTLVPIRYDDRFEIMKWRNEQIEHLRQNKILTPDDQNAYFNTTVLPLFTQEQPGQLLFSYLENNTCIGYGGLVHLNWYDKNAEISFLINTSLQNEGFEKHWTVFLTLIQQVAFRELKLHKIFTYAFDIRPHLYPVLEKAGFQKEAVLKEHVLVNNEWKDVVIHALFFPEIKTREVTWEDRHLILSWANDKTTRQFSFNNNMIFQEEHFAWLALKLADPNAHLFICTVNKEPAAFVRFDKKSDMYIIGINVNPQFRGKHLSVDFIKKSLEKLPQDKLVLAYIKPENKASVRTFEKAGFTYRELQNENDMEALVYQYITDGK